MLRVTANGAAIEQRGRDVGAMLDAADPEEVVHERLDHLYRRLQGHVDLLEAIAFSHQQ